MSAFLARATLLRRKALIATERAHRWRALGGAAIMLAFGLTDADALSSSEETGIDRNVAFLLLG